MLRKQWSGTLKMNAFVGRPRHPDGLQSEEWDQDQSIILDMEWRNSKEKGEGRYTVWARDKQG